MAIGTSMKTGKKRKALKKKPPLFGPADILLILFVVVVFAFRFVSCEDDRVKDLRPRLSGDWVTDVPSYAGAMISITESTITFYTIEQRIVYNKITFVEHWRKQSGDLFRINYMDEVGDEYAISMYLYNMKGKDVIRMRYQKQVAWRRVSADSES